MGVDPTTRRSKAFALRFMVWGPALAVAASLVWWGFQFGASLQKAAVQRALPAPAAPARPYWVIEVYGGHNIAPVVRHTTWSQPVVEDGFVKERAGGFDLVFAASGTVVVRKVVPK